MNSEISPALRHALYLRDRFTCVWCGCKVVPGAPTHCADAATLDHLVTQFAGGSNAPSNLMTCCHACNSHRQHTTVDAFLVELEGLGIDVEAIKRGIRNRKRRKVDLEAGATHAAKISAVLAEAAQQTRLMLLAAL